MRYSQIPKDVINDMALDVFQNAIYHGWHDEKRPAEHWLCLAISELMEAVEADRKDRHADLKGFNEVVEASCYDSIEDIFEGYIKDTFEDELADTAIRLLDLAKTFDIQLKPAEYDEADRELMIPDAEFTIIAYVLTAELAPFIEISDEVTWRVELEFIINDILCLLFMVAERYRFDLMEFVKLKMDYNRSRPFKHGGKKY